MAKTVVITGGTAGIGLATAELFARNGWNVGLIARGEERLREAEDRLKALGGRALGISADIADADAVDAAAERFENELGAIDVWVNNAMATVVSPAGDVTAEEYRRVTDVTYHGTVFGTLAALRCMRRRNRGSIVQINSVLGIRPFPLQAPYCAAKGAALAYTNALRGELIHEGVAVELSTIFLPAVNTPQFGGWARNKTGRRQIAPDPVYDPRLCANAIYFAALHPRRDVWVGRTSVLASVLQRLWPTAGDYQSASGWEAQLSDERIAPFDGNLFEPGQGGATPDGPYRDRVVSSRHGYVTSRQRDVAVMALVGLAATGLAGLLRRR